MALEKLVRVVMELVPKRTGALGNAVNNAVQGGGSGTANQFSAFAGKTSQIPAIVPAATKVTSSISALGEALTAAVTPIGAAAAGATLLVGSIAGLAGAANPYELERFKNSMSDLMAVIGKEFVPALRAITQAVQSISDDINDAGKSSGALGKAGAVIRAGWSYSPPALLWQAITGSNPITSTFGGTSPGGKGSGSSRGLGDFGPPGYQSISGLGKDVALSAYGTAGPLEMINENVVKLVQFAIGVAQGAAAAITGDRVIGGEAS